MGTFVEIILLLFIAGFLIVQSKDGLNTIFGRKRQIILDSCALIDGRIVELVRNHFVADELIIPQFVLNELQLLADGNDSHKRERARFGLDIAHELQDTAFEAKVIIERTAFPDVPTTDDKLIHLAKKMQAYLYTTDYNLAKVAAIEAVSVLNVNELSQALRPIALPGETLKIKIVQKGSNQNQGVGYLDDGTMIVVEGGARHTGKIVDVTVTRMHQTVAGKMVFGQVREENHPQHAQQRPAAHQSAAEVQKQKLQERLRTPQRQTAPNAVAVAPAAPIQPKTTPAHHQQPAHPKKQHLSSRMRQPRIM
ncbi:MAG: PIN/TRAM domain-containing protein [Candidatus Saccharibacteria bacterium]